MLSFGEKNGALTLSGTGGRLVRFTVGRTRFWLGRGKATYTMSRGRFKFSQRVKEKIKVTLTEYKVTKTGAELIFMSDNCLAWCLVVLRVDLDRLDVHFEPSSGYNRLWLNIPARPDEHVYGCGERFTRFDLRGEKVKIWVAEHINIASILKKLVRKGVGIDSPDFRDDFEEYETYYSQPTYISSSRYFMHADTTGFCLFDFSNPNHHAFEFREIRDLHFGFADSFYALASKLSDLLGRQPAMPEWAYDGAILGIQGGTDTVLEKLRRADEYGTKTAALWCQDWEGRRITSFGKQLMWNWRWDEELYPDLPERMRELKARGVRFLGYINTFLAIEKDMYEYAHAHGYCVKDAYGEDYLVKITTFPAAMVDLTNPEACEWLKGIIKKNMIDFGLDGWMADFGEYLPTDCVLYSDEDPELVHCTWPARWAKLNREAIEEAGKKSEVFFFTRAGHTDTVKYSTMMWNGDQHVDWSCDYGLASVIPGMLNLNMVGFGLVHSDIGGYTTFPPLKRSEELFMRWAEMCAFTPLMRGHEGNRPDDNAQFDASGKTLRVHAHLSRAHAMLKPYLIALDRLNSERGIPVTRPVFYQYDEALAYTEATEYLLGGDMLVAPVIREGAKSRSVYLPQDKWVNLWTGEEYRRGTYEITSQFGFPPVFYRQDSEYRELFEQFKELKP